MSPERPNALLAPPGVPHALTALAREVTSAMRPTLLRTLAVTSFAALLAAGAVFVPVAADDPKPAPKAAAPKAAAPKPVPEAEVQAKLQLIHAKHYLTQLAEAYRQYVFTYGKVPADVTDGNGKALLSWRVHLLPFLEQKNVHSLVKFDKAWDNPDNDLVAKVLIKTFAPVFPGPVYVHGGHKYVGTCIRRIAGPTGMNTDFATPPAKLDLEARQAVFGRLTETDYPIIIETGFPTPWLKPDEDFEFDPKAKAVKLLGAHEAGTLVATAAGNVKLVSREPDAATFADWMTKGAKAAIEPAKLFPPAGELTDADKAAADQIESMWLYHMEAKQKLEQRRLKLRQELVAQETPAGDPDPLRMTRQLGEINTLANNFTLESEVKQLEEELKKRKKK